MKEMKIESDFSKLSELIAKYRKLPIPSNRAILQHYLNHHVMFIVNGSKEQIDFMEANGFQIT